MLFFFLALIKGDLARFRELWEESVADAAARSLKLVAVSFPDLGADTGLAVHAMNAVMSVPISRTVEEDLGGVKDGRAGLQGATGDGTVEATPARAALNVWQVQMFFAKRTDWVAGRVLSDELIG